MYSKPLTLDLLTQLTELEAVKKVKLLLKNFDQINNSRPNILEIMHIMLLNFLLLGLHNI